MPPPPARMRNVSTLFSKYTCRNSRGSLRPPLCQASLLAWSTTTSTNGTLWFKDLIALRSTAASSKYNLISKATRSSLQRSTSRRKSTTPTWSKTPARFVCRPSKVLGHQLRTRPSLSQRLSPLSDHQTLRTHSKSTSLKDFRTTTINGHRPPSSGLTNTQNEGLKSLVKFLLLN